MPRLVTPRFVLIGLSGLAYFVGFTALYPVLPRYVEDLGGNGLEVGLAVGSFGITAALLRPWVGRVGDRHGRRVLVVAGMLIACISLLGHLVVDTVAGVLALRLLFGVGEAAAFVGLATAIQDLAPPDRRAEAASYFSASVYGGIALGPILGDYLVERSDYDLIWMSLAVIVALGAVLGFATPGRGSEPLGPKPEKGPFLHPEALWPGLSLAAAMLGYAGFVSFIALLLDDRGGSGSAGLAFSIYALITLTGRVAGARVPDRIGEIRAASWSLILIAIGLFFIAGWASPVGLYVGIFGLASGMALNFPALVALVTRRADEADRSHAIASLVMFFDLGFGLGAFVVGGVVALSGRPAGIAFGGIVTLLGLPALARAARRPTVARRSGAYPGDVRAPTHAPTREARR